MSRFPVNRPSRIGHVIVTKSDPAANDAELRRLAQMFGGPLDGEREIPFHADLIGSDWQAPQEDPQPFTPRDLADVDYMRTQGAI